MQLVELKFTPKTSWATSWIVFDGQNKFVVSVPMTVVGGMIHKHKELSFLIRAGLEKMFPFSGSVVNTDSQSCDYGADI